MRIGPRMVAASLVLVASSFTWSRPAAGLTLTARTQGEVLGSVHGDTQGPASSGSLLSTSPFPEAFRITFTDTAFAQAAMNDSGVGAAVADGALPAQGGNLPRAATHGHSLLRAEATWSESVTNPFSVGVEYIYHFTLTPPRLTLVDATGGAGDNSPSDAAYEIVTTLNNTTIFRSYAILSGKADFHTLTEQGTDLGGTPFSNQAEHSFGYVFSPFTASLSLGVFLPGQSFTVTTQLVASANSAGDQRGARAEIGDPLDLGGEPGIKNSFILASPVAVELKTWSAVKDLYR